MPRFLLLLCALVALPVSLKAQGLPAFCEQVSQDQLRPNPRPYALHQTADHSSYCEGMLSSPIAAHPAEIVSAKFLAAADFRFTRGSSATLSWCKVPGVDLSTHLSLRSVKPVSYALDSQAKDSFSWNSDLVGFLHPDYSSIAALATASATLKERAYDVVLPVRNGTSGNGDYVFIVHSLAPQIQLVEAHIESLTDTSSESVPVRIESTAPNFWTVRASFGKKPAGIYRLTLRDDPKASGLATIPIYFVHGGCS